MSWSDDIRCLYCDGRLPLYRKITHGQFCSSAHRKQYWQEQERLAVERLHQTHNSLQAYAPPPSENPVQAIPSPQPAIAREPGIAGLVPAAACVQADATPRLVAGDPLEYEIEVAPLCPASAAPPGFVGRLQVAGLVSVEAARAPHVSLLQAALWTTLQPATAEAIGAPGITTTMLPSASAHLDRAPVTAGPLRIPTSSPLESRLASAVLNAPLELLAGDSWQAQYASLTVAGVSGELDRMLEQLPRPERLYPLRHIRMQGLPPAAPVVTWAGALPALANSPVGTELASERPAPVFPDAGRVPFGKLIDARAMESKRTAPDPLQFESKGLEGVGSLHTSPVVSTDQQLPLAAGVSYSVKPRIAPLKSTAQAPALSPGRFSRPAELPPLLMEVGESPDAWMVPPAQKVAFGKTAYIAPPPSQPRKVLVLPQPLRTRTVLPISKLDPATARPVNVPSAIEILAPPPLLDAAPLSTPLPASGTEAGPTVAAGAAAGTGSGAVAIAPWWAHASGFWKHGPRDLKLLLMGIPVLIALAFHPGLPKVRLSAGRPNLGISQAFHTQLASFRQSMAERAAVALDEDFRSGLDDWNSRSGDATGWSYDATGFVKPGPLALYAPSQGLTNYQMQFLGMIGKKSMSWVVRAADFDNFYVVKLVERKGGPLPEIGVTRYAVINGKAQDRVDTTVAISARPEMMYLVRMDVKGNDFSMWVQDQMVDSWSEPRLPRGGVGFYSAKGEESLVRWVQITHQYDMLGRLCAYLAPSNFAN
jgi:hypothetical protein